MESLKNAFPEVVAVMVTENYPHLPQSRGGGNCEARGALRTQRVGFTLIEILIILIIMGLLAAILYPVFSRVREKSRQITCASGLRQIGLAVLQYSQDWDETMPLAVTHNDVTGKPLQYWRDAIYPYIRNEGIFNCPSDTGLHPTYRYKYLPDRSVPAGTASQGSYWCNATYSLFKLANGTNLQGPCVDPTARDVFRLQRLAGLESPSTTIWAADCSGGRRRPALSWEVGPTVQLGITTDPTYPGRPYLLNGNVANNGIVGWHQETANVLWCDGHVKAVPPSKLAEIGGSGNRRAPRFFTVADD